MSIGTSVFSYLKTLSFPVSLVDKDNVVRIYPNYQLMGDKVYPALVYQFDNYEPGYTMSGTDGMPTTKLSIIAISDDYKEADALAQFLVTTLDATRGTWGTTTITGCFVDEVSEEHFVDTDMETVLYFEKTVALSLTYMA